MQLEAVRIVTEKVGGIGLIILPLGVRQEFMRDADMLGTKVKFIRTDAEIEPGFIHLTNYESVREGKIDPAKFTCVSLDEASCLRGFGGTKTFREFMATIAGDDRRDLANQKVTEGVPYRFVATATPSPNEFIELLAYSAFLGVMDVSQSKTRFFKRNSEKADQLTIHPHKIREFWLWVASWAIFVQKPSDICNCSCHKEKTSSIIDSGSLSSRNGKAKEEEPADGYANATAAVPTSLPQATSPEVSSLVADVSGRCMEEREQPDTQSGDQLSIDALIPSTKTGPIMADGVSRSVIDGSNSPTSSPTWDSHQSPAQLNERTTQGDMNPTIASGHHGRFKQETHEETSTSPLRDEANPLPPGLKTRPHPRRRRALFDQRPAAP